MEGGKDCSGPDRIALRLCHLACELWRLGFRRIHIKMMIAWLKKSAMANDLALGHLGLAVRDIVFSNDDGPRSAVWFDWDSVSQTMTSTFRDLAKKEPL